MTLNLNYDIVAKYKEDHGIKKRYEGELKKLVDVTFCNDIEEEQLAPPIYPAVNVEDELLEDSFEEVVSDEEENEEIDSESEIESEED